MPRAISTPGTGERIGHYAPINNVPDAFSGSFRLVWEHHPLPGAGAAEYTYSTFMIPPNNLAGAGQPLDRGVPSAVQPASDAIQPYILANPGQPLDGTFGRIGLLPSDLVSQFSGKVPG
jgi:hypothetical protein